MKNTFELISNENCIASLSFTLQEHLPPTLPSVAIAKIHILENGGGQVLNFVQSAVGEFAQIFQSLFPNCSLVELFRLRAAILDSNLEDKQELVRSIFDGWHIQVDDRLDEIAKKILSFPVGIQKYFAEKMFVLRELSFTLLSSEMKLTENWFHVLEHMVAIGFSKSEFTQACDLLCSFFQNQPSSRAAETELTKFVTPAELLQSLRQIVYPRATQDDQTMDQKLQTQPWFQKKTMRWIRLGDRSGIELKTVIQSSTDAKRFEQSLNPILQTLKEDTTFWRT